MTSLDSTLKSRDITSTTKVHIVKAMIFPIVMYGRESWTIKKGEWWRIDAFWTVVLEKTLEGPLDCKEIQPVYPKGNQSWIFIGRTDAEAEALKYWNSPISSTWCEELAHWQRLMLGKIEGRRRRGWQRVRWLMTPPTWWTWVWTSSGSWWRTGKPVLLQFMGLQKVGHNWATELNWERYWNHRASSLIIMELC